jgi:hypothetical protein
MSDFVPKICGNELEKDGAAWIAPKCILPMLSLSQKKKKKTRTSKRWVDIEEPEEEGKPRTSRRNRMSPSLG